MRLATVVLLLLLPSSALAAPAEPLDPITGILDAFRTHDIVALGEGSHGNEQGATFRLSLIRDPRFARIVNDIVMECGDSNYQAVMDRFVSGHDVAYDQLKQAWQNTTQANFTCDRPIYEEMYRAVRAVNAKLPTGRQLRVLLGDPPIDWSKIDGAADLVKIKRQDTFPARLIEREVLAKHRRALIVYGDMHYLRKNLYFPLKDRDRAEADFNAPTNSIVSLLEAAGAQVFSIRTETAIDLAKLQNDIATWSRPSLAIVRDTPLGMAPFTFYYPYEMTIIHGGNPPEHVAADPVRSPRMEDEFDAVLYLGPPASITISRVSAALCADPGYVKMRSRRLAFSGETGLGNTDGLAKECTRPVPK